MSEALERGGTVLAPDGRIGSLLEEVEGGWAVCLPVEEPHPERPGRLVARTERLELPSGDLTAWTAEMEADLLIATQAREAGLRADAELARLDQVRADIEFGRLVAGRGG